MQVIINQLENLFYFDYRKNYKFYSIFNTNKNIHKNSLIKPYNYLYYNIFINNLHFKYIEADYHPSELLNYSQS